MERRVVKELNIDIAKSLCCNIWDHLDWRAGADQVDGSQSPIYLLIAIVDLVQNLHLQFGNFRGNSIPDVNESLF